MSKEVLENFAYIAGIHQCLLDKVFSLEMAQELIVSPKDISLDYLSGRELRDTELKSFNVFKSSKSDFCIKNVREEKEIQADTRYYTSYRKCTYYEVWLRDKPEMSHEFMFVSYPVIQK